MLNEESTRRAVQSEIAQTFQRMQGTGKQYIQSCKRVEAAELAYDGVSKRFAKGLVSPLELHTSANEVMQARAEQLRSRLDYIIQCRMVDYYNGEPLIK
jgi:outer membrane protein